MPVWALYKRTDEHTKILYDYMAEHQILFRQAKDKIWIDGSSITRIKDKGYIWVTLVSRLKKKIPAFRKITFEKYVK